jgi:hypothetical protein
MEASTVWGVSVGELEQALRAVDRAALLVPARIVRRVIKQDREILGPGLRVPHRKTYVISRERLLSIVDRDELGLEATSELPDQLILLARPEAEKLASMTRSRALVKYWRLLFHARIHVALDQQVAAGHLREPAIRERIERIGPTEFAEIATVLRQDDFLLPPVCNQSTYVEFVAVYLELRYFARALLSSYFPSIQDFAQIDEIVLGDLNAATIYELTRPEGAPDPEDSGVIEDEETSWDRRSEQQLPLPRKQSERTYCKLMERADRARARGNVVRSAILRTRAALVIGPKLARAARAEGREDLERLVRRMQTALALTADEAEAWPSALAGLLQQSTRGIWTHEARFLYDLQKVCIDHERGVFTLDLVSWAISRGRRPIKRQLPSQGEVLISKHLRGAANRLKATRISPTDRRHLSSLLDAAVHRAEQKLRETLRPRLSKALDEVGLHPGNLPERVAFMKLIEELLDLIVERGFLTMGDVRDAISRSNLKIHDVVGMEAFVAGDKILQADRRLAEILDGVYRPGEIYLRLPQAMSSLAFGTRSGRFLTRYVILPFGGAYVALEALQHIVSSIWDLASGEQHHFHIGTPLYVLLLGSVFLGLLHNMAFRRLCLQGLRTLVQAGRVVFVDVPLKIWNVPWLRKFLDSRPLRQFFRYALKPLLFSLLVTFALSLAEGRSVSMLGNMAIFVAMNLLLNSRFGRNVDEMVTDLVVRSWHQLRIRIVAAFLRLIVDTFSELLQALERFLYTVDELLRFRGGEHRLSMAIKAVLFIIWFFVTYVIRIYVNLLIEPQVNPIKHFPVVTVSHKFILPASPYLIELLRTPLMPLGAFAANTIAGTTVFLLPGVFGFLVWELKENWRLYAANRPPALKPVNVGRHGENIVGLLRPGFHSGTIPKLFTRLRRADRKAHATGKWKASRKHRERLRSIEESVRHFIQREFIVLLELSQQWKPGQIEVGRIRIGLNNLRIEINAPEWPDEPLVVSLEEQAGWLVAGVSKPSWLEEISSHQLQTLSTALTGLYKMSGVDLVREQLLAGFEPLMPNYEFCEQGLIVWPDALYQSQAVYDLHANPEIVPQVSAPLADHHLPTLDARQVVFGRNPILWSGWVEMWEQQRPDVKVRPQILDASLLLSLAPQPAN